MTTYTPSIDVLHERGRELLQLQMRSIDALIHDLAPPLPESAIDEVDDHNKVLVWMLQAIGVSLDSVLKLTVSRDMGVRDCFGIARSAAETAVNAAFVTTGGAAVAERAIRHMRQKRWRDLQRTGRIGNQTVSVSRRIHATPSDFPGLEEALVEFTTKKGGEVREWTPESIDQRIDAIERKSEEAGRLLAAAIFTIYRPSSELLHGTFYGVNYFWQGSLDRPIASRAEFDQLWMSDHFTTLLSSLVFATSGAIYATAATQLLPSHFSAQRHVLGLLQQLATELSAGDPDVEQSSEVGAAGGGDSYPG